MMTPNAELHEIGYLIIGGVGFLLTLTILLLRGWDVIHRYMSGVNGEYRALAWERFLSCAGLLTFNAYMLWIAYRALSLPPREWTLAYRAGIFFFYYTAVAVILLALFQWYLRLTSKAKK